MNRRSLEKLRLDRRLTGRHGWISQADITTEIEKMPDAGEKVAAAEVRPDPDESDAQPPEAGS
jgi:hypothetical protein